MGGNKRYSQLETMVVKVIMKWQWLDVLKRDYPINFLTDGLFPSPINYLHSPPQREHCIIRLRNRGSATFVQKNLMHVRAAFGD